MRFVASVAFAVALVVTMSVLSRDPDDWQEPTETSVDTTPTAADVPEPTRSARQRSSRAVGTPSDGRLLRGVKLPDRGPGYVTHDVVSGRSPSPSWRRWGTDATVRTTMRALRRFAREHPRSPRVLVGDLSRPKGGDFGPEYGVVGHVSHQNGLDVDVYYPRTDRKLQVPHSPGEVDTALAQGLVDEFVAAGAEKVFVGPSLDLKGPRGVVIPLRGHDNHLHVRFAP